MPPEYFDVHTHLNFSAYEKDLSEVLETCRQNKIWLVNVGSQKDTSQKAVDIAATAKSGVFAAVGLHPTYVSVPSNAESNIEENTENSDSSAAMTRHSGNSKERPILNLNNQVGSTMTRHSASSCAENIGEKAENIGGKFDYDFYKKLALNPKVVAIGECGLDYAVFAREKNERPQKRASADLSAKASASAEALCEGGLTDDEIENLKDAQKKVFIKQIELAKDVKKPLMIHCRNSQGQSDAFPDLISILNSSATGGSASGGKSQILNPVPGIIHFFSGNLNDAKKLLDLGFYFSFGGAITYVSRKTGLSGYEEALKFLPVERILSETDAPYVAPNPYRGQRNEPLFMLESIKKIAEIKSVPLENLKEQLIKNAFAVFRLPSFNF